MSVKKFFFQITSLKKPRIENIIKKYPIKLIAPFYHTVSNEVLPHCQYLFNIKSIAAFEKDLDFFLQYYQPLTAPELQKIILNGESFKAPSFFLSFDDGLSQVYDIIAPILVRKGVPATFFINNNFLDNKELFYRSKIALLIDSFYKKKRTKSEKTELQLLLKKENNRYSSLFDLFDLSFYNLELIDELAALLKVDFKHYLQQEQPYLTTEQVHSLIKQGFSVGSHSKSHPLYFKISTEQQVIETIEGMQFIEANFNIPYRFFAFPFTDEYLGSDFFKEIAPYIDLSFGTAGLKIDSVITNLQRISMEVNELSAEQIISAEYFYFKCKKFFNRNKIDR